MSFATVLQQERYQLKGKKLQNYFRTSSNGGCFCDSSMGVGTLVSQDKYHPGKSIFLKQPEHIFPVLTIDP